MDQFAAYGHAIVSIAIWSIIVLLLSPISAALKTRTGLAPGGTPVADYADRTYRIDRSYHNTVETLTVFAAVTLAAMLAGAPPFWVNMLASATLVARIVMIFIHIQGFGRPANGPRTGLYVLGWALQIAMAVLAIVAVL